MYTYRAMDRDMLPYGEEAGDEEEILREAEDRGIGRKASMILKNHPDAGVRFYSDRLPFLPVYRSYREGELEMGWRMWEKDLRKAAEQRPDEDIVVGGEHRREIVYGDEPVYRDTAEFPRYRVGGSGKVSYVLRFRGEDGRQRYHSLTPIGSQVDIELYRPGEWEEELDRLYHEVRGQD